MPQAPMDTAAFAANATRVAETLKSIGNPRRLVVLCKLIERGEMAVGELAAAVGLSQSALSQHLARMRDRGLVASRRESQTVWYRIADPKAEELLAALYRLYCDGD